MPVSPDSRTTQGMEGMMDNTEDSFTSAWSKAAFPPENRSFVESLCAAVGISRYQFVPAAYRYIAATRRDGSGELRIHSGCTTGFTEEEAHRFGAGADEVRLSSTRGRGWLVSHPQHGDVALRGPAAKTTKRAAERCPGCGIYELSITGVCPGCDE